MKKFIMRKVRLGRFGLPAWSIALAVLMVAAVAGQAVGPVLSGSVTGSVGMVVEQAVTLDTTAALGANPTTYLADDSVTTRNDEGTEFTVAMELNVGQTVYACVFLENASGNDASAILELNVPKGIDVEVQEFSLTATTVDPYPCHSNMDNDGLVKEAQLSRNTWLATVDDTAGTGTAANTVNDGLRITIEPQDDIAPGFYTITGRLVQIEG